MRKLVLPGLLAALALLTARPAQAYDGPWCAVFSVGFGVVQEKCDMTTFESCRQEAQLYGPTAFCRQNNYWPGYWGVGAPPEPRARKKQRKPR